MLLDLKIEIDITNNGIENNINVKTSQDNKWTDVGTALQLAINAHAQMLYQFVADQNPKLTQDQADELMQTATLKELVP